MRWVGKGEDAALKGRRYKARIKAEERARRTAGAGGTGIGRWGRGEGEEKIPTLSDRSRKGWGPTDLREGPMCGRVFRFFWESRDGYLAAATALALASSGTTPSCCIRP